MTLETFLIPLRYINTLITDLQTQLVQLNED